jgi:hypothetical protein
LRKTENKELRKLDDSAIIQPKQLKEKDKGKK